MAQYPKHITEAVSQAYGAAGKVVALLSQDTVTASGSVCEVERRKCMGCGACTLACTYGAISFREAGPDRKATVNPVLCKGCGLCSAKCPTRAITLKHFTHDEIISQIDAAFADSLTTAK
jgi:heterodisulfide reductase subunit A